MITIEKLGTRYNTPSGTKVTITLNGLAADDKPTGTYQNYILRNGSVFIEVDTGTIYLYDEENGVWNRASSDFESAADLAAALASGAAAEKCSYGDLITVSRTTSDGVTKTYDWEIIGINEDGENTLTLQLYHVYDELLTMGREALAYFPNGLSTGHYSIGLPDYKRSCMIPDAPERIYFDISYAIPAGGQLCIKPGSGISLLLAYESNISETPIHNENIAVKSEPQEGVTYTDLGTADGNSENINHISRAIFGADYVHSELRSWLASDEAAENRTWTAVNNFSRIHELHDGFLYGWESGFAAMIKTVDKHVHLVQRDTVTELENGYSLTASDIVISDKAWLPSLYDFGKERYDIVSQYVPEGEKYSFFDNYPLVRLDSSENAVAMLTRSQDWLTENALAYGAESRFGEDIQSFGIAPIVVLGAVEEMPSVTSEIGYTRAEVSAPKRIRDIENADYAYRLKVMGVINSAYSSRPHSQLKYRNLCQWYRDGYIDDSTLYLLRDKGVITPAQYAYITGDHSHDNETPDDWIIIEDSL